MCKLNITHMLKKKTDGDGDHSSKGVMAVFGKFDRDGDGSITENGEYF